MYVHMYVSTFEWDISFYDVFEIHPHGWMENKLMKGCSTSLVRKMQINTMLRYHYTY